ncbi:hypothetical protein SAMN00120144_2378 [Hymenobacter roseosalivarius DSM 11622]|uniref:Uncharacterized protein n=1 Tax=Hymenobacter roseosalivarius DSM 11622 TaxID=645990 RepID=A0A1W1UZN1_9BACT|nr:hypothetical protein SAMN00120144_2378 [Hymenobacter roseosalivarius DSM 11622]
MKETPALAKTLPRVKSVSYRWRGCSTVSPNLLSLVSRCFYPIHLIPQHSLELNRNAVRDSCAPLAALSIPSDLLYTLLDISLIAVNLPSPCMERAAVK